MSATPPPPPPPRGPARTPLEKEARGRGGDVMMMLDVCSVVWSRGGEEVVRRKCLRTLSNVQDPSRVTKASNGTQTGRRRARLRRHSSPLHPSESGANASRPAQVDVVDQSHKAVRVPLHHCAVLINTIGQAHKHAARRRQGNIRGHRSRWACPTLPFGGTGRVWARSTPPAPRGTWIPCSSAPPKCFASALRSQRD